MEHQRRYTTSNRITRYAILVVSTKRDVVQAIGHVYDPLGYFCSSSLAAKSFLQYLWDKILSGTLSLKRNSCINGTKLQQKQRTFQVM